MIRRLNIKEECLHFMQHGEVVKCKESAKCKVTVRQSSRKFQWEDSFTGVKFRGKRESRLIRAVKLWEWMGLCRNRIQRIESRCLKTSVFRVEIGLP